MQAYNGTIRLLRVPEDMVLREVQSKYTGLDKTT